MLKLDFYQKKNEHRKQLLDKLNYRKNENIDLEFHYNDEDVHTKGIVFKN